MFDIRAHLAQGVAANARVEIIAGLHQRRGGQAPGDRHHPVLDGPILGDQHRQRPLGLQPHEFDMLEALVILGRHHDPRAPREARQHARGLGQHALQRQIARGGGDLRVDAVALVERQVADFEQGVHEKAQAQLGGQAPGAGVGGVDEAQLLQVLHDIADRGGGEGHGQQARELARPHRLARGEVGIDDAFENLARTIIQRRERGPVERQRLLRERIMTGHGPKMTAWGPPRKPSLGVASLERLNPCAPKVITAA